MQAIEDAFGTLVDELQWFVVADEIRAMHIVADAKLMERVVEFVAAAEHNPRNDRGFLLLQEPFGSGETAWDALCEELVGEYQEFAEAVAEGTRNVALAPFPKTRHADGSLARFGLALKALVGLRQEPINGFTIVLTPVDIEDPAQWTRELTSLLSQPALREVKWVIAEVPPAKGRVAVQTAFEQKARVEVDVVVPRRAFLSFMEHVVQGLRNAQQSGGAPMLGGRPGPKVVPPRRKSAKSDDTQRTGKLSSQQRALMEEAGVPPEHIQDPADMQALTLHVLSASQHAAHEEWPQAVAVQRNACEQARSLGLQYESLTLELTLGCYLMQAGDLAQARAVLKQVKERADAGGHHDQLIQAMLAIGGTLAMEAQHHNAAVAYTEAGAMGQRLDEPMLAIEGYRMAGQYALQGGAETHAVKVWKRALALAEALPDEMRLGGSTAAEAAHALADLCERRGLVAQAQSLRTQAAALARPVVPDAPESKRGIG